MSVADQKPRATNRLSPTIAKPLHNAWCLLFLLLLLVLLPTGCGTLHFRAAVPASEVNQAQIEGFPDVRDWGDLFSPVLQQSVMEALTQESLPDNPLGKTPVQYLALSGGGMNGAFGAGLLCGWSASGTRPVFDFVTGTSAGALLAPFAFVGSSQDATLREIYSHLEAKDLFQRKGLLRIFRDDSVHDTSPLRHLLEKYINDELLAEIAREHARGRRLWIGTANLDAHRPVIWDMGRIARTGRPDAKTLFIQVMMASAAIPGAFPPMYFKVTSNGKTYDEMHVDGGICRQVFAYGPVLHLDEIRKGLDAIGRERPAELYIIRNGDLGTHYDPIKPRLVPIVMNSLQVLTQSQAEGDFYRMFVYAGRDKCKYNLTGIPPGYQRHSLKDFDGNEMRRLFQLGEQMGHEESSWYHTPWDARANPAVKK